jgi:arginase
MDAAQVMAGRVSPDDFVFCLGGECTLATGTLAGFKHRFEGKPGMVWVDAHGDFNTPETTSSGFLGGMPLAFACGRGPKLNQNIEDARPLLEEKNVVHLGSRALDPLESEAMSSSPMKVYPASTIHKEGASKTADEAAAYLAAHADWITCHLDIDSIDPTIIPAVYYPEPRGLTLEQVKTIVGALQKTGKLKVFNLAAYNPAVDNEHTSARMLVTLVEELMKT